MPPHLHFRRIFVPILLICATLGGCTRNMVRDVAGVGMMKFGNEYISPWLMASDDTDVLCAMGEGMAAIAYPLGPKIDPMVPMMTMASAMCAEEKSREEELRYLRAMRKNDIETAQDARTMQKRWASLSAKRLYFGYQAIVRYYGEPGQECPQLENINFQLGYLFGLLGGVQALQTDMATGGTLKVPGDVMPKALKGLDCLNSDELWGIPNAIQAAVDLTMARMDQDQEAIGVATAKLEAAERVGMRDGVRMVQFIAAAVYSSQGDEEKTKQVIRAHAASKQRIAANPNLKLVDEMATRGILMISDKLWTQHTGQRTPYNKLGEFWDDQAASGTSLDIDDLL